MNRKTFNPGSILRHATTVIVSLLATGQMATAVVGYVNLTATNGYTLAVNPLDTGSYNILNVIPSAPDGTRVWLWNPTNQLFDPPSTFISANANWTLNLSLPPGRGFVVHSPSTFFITFVGEVLQGSLTNFLAGTNKLTLVGSKVPVGGNLTQHLLFPGSDGDVVSVYPPVNQRYLDGYTYLSGYGWLDPQGVVGTNGPSINVANSFFIRHRGPDTNWVRNFTVQAFAPGLNLTGSGGSGGAPPPDILGLTIQNGMATLRVSATDRPYNVQFSPDGSAWTTVAANQIGGSWTGPCPTTDAGYFQLVSP